MGGKRCRCTLLVKVNPHLERFRQRHHLVQDTPQGPYVGFVSVGYLAEHLGTHENWCADEGARCYFIELELSRNSKVTQRDARPSLRI